MFPKKLVIPLNRLVSITHRCSNHQQGIHSLLKRAHTQFCAEDKWIQDHAQTGTGLWLNNCWRGLLLGGAVWVLGGAK